MGCVKTRHSGKKKNNWNLACTSIKNHYLRQSSPLSASNRPTTTETKVQTSHFFPRFTPTMTVQNTRLVFEDNSPLSSSGTSAIHTGHAIQYLMIHC